MHYSSLSPMSSSAVHINSCPSLIPIYHFLNPVTFRLLSNLFIFSVVYLFPSMLVATINCHFFSLFIPSIHPYKLNLSCFVNFTISAPCNIPCIFCYETTIFPYNLPFEYSKGMHFSEAIFRASTP